jgi:diguanylate cyclase (GGDEF)-like protein
MTLKIPGNLENSSAQVGTSSPKLLMDNFRLEKLFTALMAIISSTNQQEILEIASSELKNILSAKACSLSIWDKERDIITFLTEQGFGSRGERNFDETNYSLEEQPLIEFVLKNNEVKNITAYQPGIDPAEKKLLDDFGIKSLLFLPLAAKNQVIGLMGVYDENERSFENDEILIAKIFSHHVAVALENAKLLSEAQIGHDEQKALYESAMIISTSLDLNTILTKLAEHVCELVDATSVYLSSFDPTLKSSTMLAEYFGSDASEKERVSDLGFVYDLTTELPAILNLMQSGEPLIYHVDDPDLDETERAYLEKYGGISVLKIPLQSGGEFNAYLEVWETRNKREFTKKEIILCETIASQAAIAIENVKLLSEAQKGYDEQKALHESAMIISTSLDLNTILTKLAEQVCELVDASSVYIASFNPETKTSKVIAEYYSSFATEKERVSDLGDVYSNSHDFLDMLEFFQTGEVWFGHIDDPDLDETIRSMMEKYGGQSILEIPLRVGGEFNAVIEIWDTRGKREFTKNEISLSQTIAMQAAIAIENANLFNKAQEEIAAREIIEEKLKHDSLHDPLTDLPNRILFLDRLEQAIFRNNRFDDLNFAVVFADIDQFKQINDTFGHSTGDKVLIEIARIFQESIREVDTVSRFGGDEFIFILEGPMDLKDAKRFAERIQENLNMPIKLGGNEFMITASMGVALSSREANTPDDIIRNADIAMYNAKAGGKGRCEIFTPTIE